MIIKDIYITIDKAHEDTSIMIVLDDDNSIIIDSYWAYKYKLEDREKYRLGNLQRLNIPASCKNLVKISAIEGVTTFIELTNKCFVILYDEIRSMDPLDVVNRVKMIGPLNESELNHDLLDGLEISEEVILESTLSKELKSYFVK